MTKLEAILLVAGVADAGLLIAIFAWSILFPRRRLWPPAHSIDWSAVIAWLLTVAVFVLTIALGILGWGEIGLPGWVRWGIGLPLVLAGNAVVWAGVARIGMKATSGAKAELVTTGLYRYSRNPQYVADMAILVGFVLVTSAWFAIPVAAAGVLALAVAPFAEEPWLKQSYGEDFETYRSSTRRYF